MGVRVSNQKTVPSISTEIQPLASTSVTQSSAPSCVRPREIIALPVVAQRSQMRENTVPAWQL